MTVSLSALQGPERMNGKMTLWGCFAQHRRDARKREIEFKFTFEEWIQTWKDSGQLDNRGPKQGQYVMARFGDKGPYASWNVKIITSSENHREGNMGKPKPGNAKHCRKLGLSNKGRTLSKE